MEVLIVVVLAVEAVSVVIKILVTVVVMTVGSGGINVGRCGDKSDAGVTEWWLWWW